MVDESGGKGGAPVVKIVSSKEMARIESLAYREGAEESLFMERAGEGVALVVNDYVEKNGCKKRVILLCGKGNNSGDGYVAGCYLLEKGYTVLAVQSLPEEGGSKLCLENRERFLGRGGEIRAVEELDSKELEQCVIVDALFGTGFRGKIFSPLDKLVEKVNRSRSPVIAIDIPSGVNGSTGLVESVAIEATETVCLGLPKCGLFIKDGWNYVGSLRFVDFGLDQSYISEGKEEFFLLEREEIVPLLPKKRATGDKYSEGSGLLTAFAGSPGMGGAACLSILSALRSGAGIVRLLHPEGMEMELSKSAAEVVKVPYGEGEIDLLVDQINCARGGIIGPGVGRSLATKKILRELLERVESPVVIDADALTIIAEEGFTLSEGAVLTPHLGEMARLLKVEKPKKVAKEFLDLCSTFAQEKGITLVLKGGPTFIFTRDQKEWICCRGDRGMATAGSGDVLTGVIGALLAQGCSGDTAAKLGVYLHGVAGEKAAKEFTSYSLIASDLIEKLPDAFKGLLPS